MSKTVTIDRPEGKQQYSLQPNDFTIDPSNLEYDLCNMARVMLDYGDIESELRAEVERKEASLSLLEAELDATIRVAAKDSPTRVTEGQIKNTIIRHSDRQALLTSIRSSRQNHNLIRWAMTALQSKRDCLINLSYRERQLMKSEAIN